MLRRYLIVNGATTAVLYGAIYALAPTLKLESLRASFEDYVMESPVLGPLLNKIILVTSAL